MAKNPVNMALWGMLVGNIEGMGILPALQGGEVIARALEGADPIEKLRQIDGDDNQEIVEKDGFRYVILKSCPFKTFYKDLPPWGERSVKLVEAYNKKDDGGGALHPLCLVHKGVRNGLRAGIISVACRSEATGKIEVAEKALEKAGLTREAAVAMVEGKGCLFALKA